MTVQAQFGAKIEWDVTGGTTFVEITEATLIPVPAKASTPILITPHNALTDNAGYDEFIPNPHKTHDTLDFTVNFDAANTQHVALETEAETASTPSPNFQVTYSLLSETRTFQAIVTNFKVTDLDAQGDAQEMFTLTLQPTGAIT